MQNLPDFKAKFYFADIFSFIYLNFKFDYLCKKNQML